MDSYIRTIDQKDMMRCGRDITVLMQYIESGMFLPLLNQVLLAGDSIYSVMPKSRAYKKPLEFLHGANVSMGLIENYNPQSKLPVRHIHLKSHDFPMSWDFYEKVLHKLWVDDSPTEVPHAVLKTASKVEKFQPSAAMDMRFHNHNLMIRINMSFAFSKLSFPVYNEILEIATIGR